MPNTSPKTNINVSDTMVWWLNQYSVRLAFRRSRVQRPASHHWAV